MADKRSTEHRLLFTFASIEDAQQDDDMDIISLNNLKNSLKIASHSKREMKTQQIDFFTRLKHHMFTEDDVYPSV